MSYRIDHHHAYTEKLPPNLLDTIVNNLDDLDSESAKSLSNQVPTPTSSIPEIVQIDFMNITDAKSEDLDSNVVVDEEGKKNKKKKRKKKKSMYSISFFLFFLLFIYFFFLFFSFFFFSFLSWCVFTLCNVFLT